MSHPLTPELVISAYQSGYFPMADDRGQIGWFSPDPRCILPLDRFKISRSLRQTIRRGLFDVRINVDFEAVMRACAHRREDGTWISEEIIAVYTALHRAGLAHSVETWRDGALVGGLYGVTLGGAFFGESMFHRATDASKVALAALVERLSARGFTLLDTQWNTPHLAQFGTRDIPRADYLDRLQSALRQPCDFTSARKAPDACQ